MFADLDRHRDRRHRQLPEVALDELRQLRCSRSPLIADRTCCGAFGIDRDRALGVEFGSTLVEVLEFTEARVGLGVERHHRGQILSVLAAHVDEELSAVTDLGESFGRLLDRIERGTKLWREIVEFR